MCHVDLRCDYKQSREGKCRPAERGSSHCCHRIVSIPMSELLLSWLPFWSSCSFWRGRTRPMSSRRFSRNWTQPLIPNRSKRRTLIRSRRTHSSLNLIRPHRRQSTTNCWWVQKRLQMLCCFFCFFSTVYAVEVNSTASTAGAVGLGETILHIDVFQTNSQWPKQL